jgi:hypothetical protein
MLFQLAAFSGFANGASQAPTCCGVSMSQQAGTSRVCYDYSIRLGRVEYQRGYGSITRVEPEMTDQADLLICNRSETCTTGPVHDIRVFVALEIRIGEVPYV